MGKGLEQFFVLRGYNFPIITLANTLAGALTVLGALLLRHSQSLFHGGQQPFFITERYSAISTYFGVLRGLAIENQSTATHLFDQRGMRSADFGRLDVGEAMRPELTIAEPINRAGYYDAWVLGIAHFANVFLSMWGIANQRQLHICFQLFESLPNFQRLILRLKAANVQEVLERLQVKLLQRKSSLSRRASAP